MNDQENISSRTPAQRAESKAKWRKIYELEDNYREEMQYWWGMVTDDDRKIP